MQWEGGVTVTVYYLEVEMFDAKACSSTERKKKAAPPINLNLPAAKQEARSRAIITHHAATLFYLFRRAQGGDRWVTPSL